MNLTIQQPSTLHITHVYHTADPLAMGTCTGVTSVCSLAGYAMESKLRPPTYLPIPLFPLTQMPTDAIAAK